MTSANITHFSVTEIATGKTTEFTQHMMCKDRTKAEFAKFIPPSAYHIEVNHPDEEECADILFDGNLEDYLKRNDKSHIPRCPVCGITVRQDIRDVTFATGGSPIFTLTQKLKAEWCSNPTCMYEKVVTT